MKSKLEALPDLGRLHPQPTGLEADEWANLPLYIREKQIRAAVFPVSHGTLWDWVSKGSFPQPVRLSSGVSAWRRGDLRLWADGAWPQGVTQ